MQTLEHELETTRPEFPTNDHPVFRQMMADPAVAYAQEVRTLRQRVAMLEAELAATKASNATKPAHTAAPSTPMTSAPETGPTRRVSEFTAPVTPAVMAVQPTTPAHAVPQPAAQPAATSAVHAPAPAPLESALDSEPVADPGFAQAWTAETEAASFEERVAEKAFFQASTVDEESRSWLLEQ